jgi:hypothetical protein
LVAYFAMYEATARSVSSWPSSKSADRADVELAAEGEGMGASVDGRAVDAGGGGCGLDGVGKELCRRPGGRWGVSAFRAVDTDDRVEVHGTALLIFGDLGEGDACVVAEGSLGEAGALGDLPAEVDGEAPPEVPGVGVPEDGRFVVVPVRVEGRA